jgi:hypothetical protein
MPYVQMQDIRLGMDRKRKSRVASELGSAWTIENAHLTRGGDIDRRKKFVEIGDGFPDTTFGLYAINDTLYTLGYDPGQVSNVPSGVTHILTQHPTPSTAIVAVKDAEPFDGLLYSILEFSDGNIYHYYDVDRVTDWDTLASDVGSNDAVAASLAAAIDKSAIVSATSSTNVVTVTGEEDDVSFTLTGSTNNFGSNPDQTITIVETQAAGASQPQINTITIGGTFEAADQFTVTLDSSEEFVVTGGSSGTGTTVLTFKQKLYSTAASNLYFCALNAPTQWISGVDYGFINMASQTGGQELLTVAEEYQGLMAIFSENNIRVWSISEDSAANTFLQTLRNTGTVAPASVTPYGNNDIFYLDTSGIRSLKARDSSNAAYVSDVGTSIDTHIREYMDTLTEAEISAATGIIEPIDGRLWIAIGKRIYVLSFFPSAKISAFSFYSLDFQVTHLAKVGDRIYARGRDDNGDDKLYLYGGTNNNEYPGDDEDNVFIELPYFGARDPAGLKELLGFDIIGINNWKVDILPDPNNDTVIVEQGITTGTTYGKPRFATSGVSPLFAVNLTCSTAGQATLSALAMHYNDTNESG